MLSLMVAACTFCSGAFAAVVAFVPAEHPDLDEQWLLSPENISVPDFRLRALRPVSADGRPLLFSCSAATTIDEPAAANISWDVSTANESGVVSVDSRTGLFGAVVVVDSLLAIEAPLRVRTAGVACRITLADGRQVTLKERVVTAQTSLAAGTVDHLRLAEYGEMGRECGRERCKSHGAVCESSSLGHLLLCACPTNMSVYDRFYDICHQGRTLHENCLFSEACSSADPDSRCVNGTCKCSEGLQSVGLGPCQRWASYGERCDRTVAGCTGLGVVCGPDSVCACERGRVRLNDSCVIQPEPESDSVTRLTPRQRVALISSVLITLTGVLLALVSLCSHLCQRCTAEGTSADDVASFKVPEWAEANSYYMSTRFWVSEQPYFSMAHRGVRRPPKMYFNW
nr:uncharacterized protein LOC126531456 isoform X1 [Dermacentor andersoni]